MKVALVQWNALEPGLESYFKKIKKWILRAASSQARMLVFPEAVLGPFQKGLNDLGPKHWLFREFSILAREGKIWLLPGTFWEKSPKDSKPYNTAFLWGPDGRLWGRYRKRKLFNVRLPSGKTISEGEKTMAGRKSGFVKGPFGLLAMGICFDLRFPEIFRKKGIRPNLILLPSNFTRETGLLHWEVLVRARAIENQAFVLAPNQFGPQKNGSPSFGHSLIVGPWGEILAKKAQGAGMILADLDFKKQSQLVKRFPLKV